MWVDKGGEGEGVAYVPGAVPHHRHGHRCCVLVARAAIAPLLRVHHTFVAALCHVNSLMVSLRVRHLCVVVVQVSVTGMREGI